MGDSVPKRLLDAWNSLDPEVVASMYTDDAKHEDLGTGMLYRGHDAIKTLVRESGQFSSDGRLSPLNEQISGDQYAIEWEMSGTNTGEVAGMPATKKTYRLRAVSVGRFDADGKVKENRDYYNMADLMTQLGLLPTPGR